MTCSILINNFNNGPFLRATIDSALQQTLPADEVIVYDDGSTDDSIDILLSYGSRIRTILAPKFSSNKNQNQIQAVNEAFKASTGKFIFLLDGDDTFLPTKLETYRAALSDPRVVMVQAPLIRIDRNGKAFGSFRHDWIHGVRIRSEISRTHDLDYFYPTSALGFRRDFLERVMPVNTLPYRTVGIDSALHILAVLHGEVVTLDEPQTCYRHHSSNLSGRFSKPFHRCQFDQRLNRFYNDHARALGHEPSLHLWRNRRFIRRTGRHVIDLVTGRLKARTPSHV